MAMGWQLVALVPWLLRVRRLYTSFAFPTGGAESLRDLRFVFPHDLDLEKVTFCFFLMSDTDVFAPMERPDHVMRKQEIPGICQFLWGSPLSSSR